MRKGFTIIEVIIVFLLILGVTFFVLPMTLDSTKQARFISKWTETYSELQYIFSTIKAQKDIDIYKDVKKAPNDGSREEIIANTIKPYLRIKSEIKIDGYRQSYMNKQPVRGNSIYSFSNFYITDFGEIIGLNWLAPDCKNEIICGVISVDLNGVEPPNTWGKDVFGINVYSDRIEPIGKNIDSAVLKDDCSSHGQGLYCSYYYLISGSFD